MGGRGTLPPRRPGPMYQWLLGALGALLAAARRRPAPPPAPPPRKRPPPSVQPPSEDPDETQAKKQKSDYAISEREEEASAGVKFPAKATREHQKASVSHAAPITESAGKAQSTSFDPSPKRPGGFALDVEMLQIDTMPCETNTSFHKETLSLSHRAIPCPSTSRNVKCYIKPAPESVLTLRPPIKERTKPESTTSEVGKMGRLFCTAEEDVQREEKVKYKQLLQLVKTKHPRSCPNPQLPNFLNVQAYSKEPVVNLSRLEGQKKELVVNLSRLEGQKKEPVVNLSRLEGLKKEPVVNLSRLEGQRKEPVVYLSRLEGQKRGGDVYPCVRLRTSTKCSDVCSPQWPQRSDMIRYYTPAENSHEQGNSVKQAIAEKQHEAEIPEESFFQLDLAPILISETFVLKVKQNKFPSSGKTVEDSSPLTEAMEREVNAALGRGDPDEIMSSAFKLKITRQDIQTLMDLCWLNDEIINFYMCLLMERSKKKGYPAVHAFNTFFYPKLISGGYDTVRRWTRDVDLFKQDLILVPIHSRLHWTLVVIDMRKKTIKYFDSLGSRKDIVCEILFQYLQKESHEKRNLHLNFSEWTLHSMESHEIPQQENGSDCGVFACKYADYISRDKPITFTQNDMPYFRKKMVWEIIHQQLL